MRVVTLPAVELTSEMVRSWSDLLRANAELDSPYFRPEFTQAVASVRDDVEVATLEIGGGLAGFFPFQRAFLNVGLPVGSKLSDFQAVIVPEELHWSARDLIEGCKLATWQFDHLLVGQRPFQAYHYGREPSPYLDLEQGFEAYQRERQRSGSGLLSQILRKARKLEREIAPLRFELHSTDTRVLDALRAWKSEQHKLTNVLDIFEIRWVVELLDRIRTTQAKGLSGVLSALYAGDDLIAVHLGIRTETVLHWWFPAFNRTHNKYSPGLILLIELAKAAAAVGLKRIDLGKGPERYKYSLASDAIMVAHGAVDCHPGIRWARQGWRRLRERVHSSPLRQPLSAVGGSLHRARQRVLFR